MGSRLVGVWEDAGVQGRVVWLPGGEGGPLVSILEDVLEMWDNGGKAAVEHPGVEVSSVWD